MVEKTCEVDGCGSKTLAKGLCQRHYHRRWRLGSASAELTRNSQCSSLNERLPTFFEEGKPDACWPWQGTITPFGYGTLKFGGRGVPAHRAVYEAQVGPIPDGMELDHLCHTRDTSCAGGVKCRHRKCVNPAHLEPVSGRVNRLRGRSRMADNAKKTHCPQGHPYDEANTYINHASGGRVCRICTRTHQAAYRRRLKGEAG